MNAGYIDSTDVWLVWASARMAWDTYIEWFGCLLSTRN